MASAERQEEREGSETRDAAAAAAAAPRKGVASFLPGRIPKEVSEGDVDARSPGNSNNNRQNVPFPVNGVANPRVSKIRQKAKEVSFTNFGYISQSAQLSLSRWKSGRMCRVSWQQWRNTQSFVNKR